MTSYPYRISISWAPELAVTGELGHSARGKSDMRIIRLSLHQKGLTPKSLTCLEGPPSSCPELKPEPLFSELAGSWQQRLGG